MKRWVKIALPLVAVAVIGGFVARAVLLRKAEQAAAAAPLRVTGLDLAASDVVAARTIELARTVDVSGGLKAVNSAMIRAKVAAEVRSLNVREGDAVKAGQSLGQLDTMEFDLRVRQAAQTAASTRTQLDIAKRALDNNRALVAQGFISATGLETSVSNEAAARATLEAANAAVALAQKALADSRLVAPISGFVSQRLVQPGERVAIDARLVEIVDLSKLELEAALAPEDVALIDVGRAATLHVDGIAAPVAATVARINPSAQAGTRAVMVYLSVAGQPALRQGLFVRGTIELATRRALALPLSAVRTDQAMPYVLRLEAGKAKRTPVTLGVRGIVGGEPWVEVSAGLAEGTPVLAASAGLVRDDTSIRLAAPPTRPSGAGPASGAIDAAPQLGNAPRP